MKASKVLTLILVILAVPFLYSGGALAQSGGEIVVSKEFYKDAAMTDKVSTFFSPGTAWAKVTVRNNSSGTKNVDIEDGVPGETTPRRFNGIVLSPNSEWSQGYNFTLPSLPAAGFGRVAGQKNKVWGTKIRVFESGTTNLLASFEAPLMIRARVPEIDDNPALTTPDKEGRRDTLWELATRVFEGTKLKARGGTSLLRWGFGWRQAQYGRSRGGELFSTLTKVLGQGGLLGQALTALFNNPSLFIFGNVFAYSTAGGRIDFGNQGIVSGTGVYGAPTQKFAIPNYSIDESSAIYWDASKAGPEKNKQINQNLMELEGRAKWICGGNHRCTISNQHFNLNPFQEGNWNDTNDNPARPEGGIWKANRLFINGNVTFLGKGLIIVEESMTIDNAADGAPGNMSYGPQGGSLGVIIKKKYLAIYDAVKVIGAYFVPGATITDGWVIFGVNSPGVFVKGSLIAKDFKFNPRTSTLGATGGPDIEGTGLEDFQGAIVYDANLIRNPPPAFANLFSAVVTPELPE